MKQIQDFVIIDLQNLKYTKTNYESNFKKYATVGVVILFIAMLVH